MFLVAPASDLAAEIAASGSTSDWLTGFLFTSSADTVTRLAVAEVTALVAVLGALVLDARRRRS